MRIKKMCDSSSEEEEEDSDGYIKEKPRKKSNIPKFAHKDNFTSDEYLLDAEKFQDKIKSDFLSYRTEFREIVDKMRTTEYETFARLGLERA